MTGPVIQSEYKNYSNAGFGCDKHLEYACWKVAANSN